MVKLDVFGEDKWIVQFPVLQLGAYLECLFEIAWCAQSNIFVVVMTMGLESWWVAKAVRSCVACWARLHHRHCVQECTETTANIVRNVGKMDFVVESRILSRNLWQLL